jgi:hypothetical protein
MQQTKKRMAVLGSKWEPSQQQPRRISLTTFLDIIIWN